MAPGPPIVVLAADRMDGERAAAAIVAAGGEPLMVASAVDEDAEVIARHPMVVLAWDGEPDVLAAVSRLLHPQAQLVALVPGADLASQVRLWGHAGCNHLIVDDDDGLAWLQVAVSKFVTGDLFGIEKYLPAGAEVRLTRLRDYAGRSRAIDEVLAYAEQVGVRGKVRAAIGQACEELLMNALYDAPVDGEGQLIFAEVGTRERLERLSPRPVSIRYAQTPAGFAVSVRDRFGRLDKATVLRYLNKCLHSGDGQIDRKTYGAGLGLYLVVNAASHVVINVAPGMATEVVCSFDRRGARTGLRGLSFFVYPGEAQVPAITA